MIPKGDQNSKKNMEPKRSAGQDLKAKSSAGKYANVAKQQKTHKR